MGNSTIFFFKITNFFLTLRDICHIVNIEKSFIRVITMDKYLLERVSVLTDIYQVWDRIKLLTELVSQLCSCKTIIDHPQLPLSKFMI